MDTPQTPTTVVAPTDTIMGDSPPKYVPKFSAATEMILQRMKSGISGGLSSIGITGTPPGYEEMRRNVMQGMRTTQNMEINTPPRYVTGRRPGPRGGSGSTASVEKSATPTASAPSTGKKRGKGPKAGQKRKRIKEESESAEESDAMSGLGGDSDSDDANSVAAELPKITQSGRQVVKPTHFVPAMTETSARKRSSTSTHKRNQEQALCKRCGRGNSPQNNMIVFCDGCNLGWHQMCHDPVVSEEEVKDEEAAWYCNDCARKRGIKPAPSKADGVSWASKTLDQRRNYLESLPHPQLVSLLMKACTLHPTLPIFPANPPPTQRRQSQNQSRSITTHPQQPFPPSSSTAGLFTRAESNPNAPINFIRKITSSSGITPSPLFTTSFTPTPTPTFAHASSAPPTLPPQASSTVNGNGMSNGQEMQESRESTPNSPPYPRAGTGLMSKLGPDEEDLEWLVDNGDFEAFSHAVYDDQGNKVEEDSGGL